ncbi:MAG: hypothetical protein KJ065_18770 [Anaerolineae bacterium]|nr:hypothetical protein [Anaerolineae bacterium]
MKRAMVLFAVAAMLLVAGSVAVQAQDVREFTVNCDNGTSFTNGIEFQVISMRAGYDYTATAVGINGFDPVLAVLGEGGNGLCSDDESSASRYAADLPTTGRVPASNLSAQVTFNHDSSSGFQDISLVVGGYGDQEGEFLLILEGMAVTTADNAGDPFSVRLTPGMIASGVPLDVYMITRGQSSVDPIISMVDEDLNVRTDNRGNEIYCDDAGSDLCWGDYVDLSNSTVTINTGTLPGWQYDTYLSLDLSDLSLSEDPDQNFLSFLMSSYEGSEGQYLLVFHAGISEARRSGK